MVTSLSTNFYVNKNEGLIKTRNNRTTYFQQHQNNISFGTVGLDLLYWAARGSKLATGGIAAHKTCNILAEVHKVIIAPSKHNQKSLASALQTLTKIDDNLEKSFIFHLHSEGNFLSPPSSIRAQAARRGFLVYIDNGNHYSKQAVKEFFMDVYEKGYKGETLTIFDNYNLRGLSDDHYSELTKEIATKCLYSKTYEENIYNRNKCFISDHAENTLVAKNCKTKVICSILADLDKTVYRDFIKEHKNEFAKHLDYYDKTVIREKRSMDDMGNWYQSDELSPFGFDGINFDCKKELEFLRSL